MRKKGLSEEKIMELCDISEEEMNKYKETENWYLQNIGISCLFCVKQSLLSSRNLSMSYQANFRVKQRNSI